MTTQAENSTAANPALNVGKWVVAVVILVAATLGNRYAPETMSVWVRVPALVALALAAFAIALTTVQGHAFLKLLKEAQIEARRVVWPTRDETLQTTMIVLAVVFVMSLVLWGLDSLFGWMISAIIG